MSVLTNVITNGVGAVAKVAVNVAGPWRLYAELAAASALALALGTQTWRLHTSQADEAKADLATKTVTEQWAEQRAAMSSAAAASQAEFRTTEQALRAQVQKGQDEIQAAQIRNDAVLASARAQLASVRATLYSFASGASGSGGAAADTVAACQHRANALGDVLAEGLRVQAELANDAESESAKVGGLLDAWPQQRADALTPPR